ncbi:uncharacterized membrane-anchored protein YhcB (DUF1043 family) [Rhodococcus sp. PvR044]|uniref:hypothetical protein n=1 Tax=Rhodococcus sp. PvR044 TaxID=3156402 RepID=UPI00339448EB
MDERDELNEKSASAELDQSNDGESDGPGYTTSRPEAPAATAPRGPSSGPGSGIRKAADAVGLLLSVIGLGGVMAGAGGAVLYWAARLLGDVFDTVAATLGRTSDYSDTGMEWLWPGSAVVAGIGLGAVIVGVLLLILSEPEDEQPSTLTRGELAAAPVELQKPMVAALGAASTIRCSAAYKDGWLPEVDLDAAVWDLAEHVKIGAQLHHQLAAFADDDSAEHHIQIDEARTALHAAIDHVSRGAQRLVTIAEQTKRLDDQLDDQLAEPQRRAELEAERDRQAAALADRAAQLADTRDALANISPALDDVADALAGRLDAYAELPVHPDRGSAAPTTTR